MLKDMNELEYVLSGKGNKQQRCLNAAFCVGYGANNGWADEMSRYYDRCYDEVVYPHVAMDIIMAEYGKGVKRLSGQFIHDLIAKMIDLDSNSSDYEEGIWEEVNQFMNT